MTHRNNFDLLRLFAACQVMFMHVGEHLKLPLGRPVTDLLWLFPGVLCFFVISGFLVTDSALRSTSASSFFWKRGLRIYPALATNIIVLDLVMFFAGGLIINFRSIPYILTYITTASSWIAWTITGFNPYLGENVLLPFYPSGVLWTLTIELSFYLVVPVIAVIAAKSLRASLALLAFIMVASAYLASHFTIDFIDQYPLLNILCPAYLWIFGIGMVLRLVWDKARWLFDERGYIWLPSYVAIGLFGSKLNCFPLGVDFHTGVDPITIFRTVFLGLTLISCAYTLKGAASILRGIDLSYGIYLWHMLFVTLLLAAGVTGRWWLWIAVPICAASVAYLSHQFVEKPMLRLKTRSISKASTSGLRADPVALN